MSQTSINQVRPSPESIHLRSSRLHEVREVRPQRNETHETLWPPKPEDPVGRNRFHSRTTNKHGKKTGKPHLVSLTHIPSGDFTLLWNIYKWVIIHSHLKWPEGTIPQGSFMAQWHGCRPLSCNISWSQAVHIMLQAIDNLQENWILFGLTQRRWEAVVKLKACQTHHTYIYIHNHNCIFRTMIVLLYWIYTSFIRLYTILSLVHSYPCIILSVKYRTT